MLTCSWIVLWTKQKEYTHYIDIFTKTLKWPTDLSSSSASHLITFRLRYLSWSSCPHSFLFSSGVTSYSAWNYVEQLALLFVISTFFIIYKLMMTLHYYRSVKVQFQFIFVFSLQSALCPICNCRHWKLNKRKQNKTKPKQKPYCTFNSQSKIMTKLDDWISNHSNQACATRICFRMYVQSGFTFTFIYKTSKSSG